MQQVNRELRHRIFVYGTLKRGEPNHHIFQDDTLGKSRFVSAAETRQNHPLIVGTKYNLPFLIWAAGRGRKIKGEVYDVDDKLFEFMDEFEGHPQVYQRDRVEVVLLEDKPKSQNKSGDGHDAHNSHQRYRRYLGKQASVNHSVDRHDGANAAGHMDRLNNPDRQAGSNADGACKNVTPQEIVENLRNMSVSDKDSKTSDHEQSKFTACTEQGHKVITTECWAYFLKKFPPKIVRAKSLDDYTSMGTHGREYNEEEDELNPDSIFEALSEECETGEQKCS